MKKLYFLMLIVGACFAKEIPQETSYGFYTRFGSVGSATSLLSIVPTMRQPMGANAIDIYADIMGIPGYVGLGGQYYYFMHDIFPIREGDLVVQYGPGLGIGLGSNYFDFALEPGAGVTYYLEKKPLELFFNVILNLEFQFFDEEFFPLEDDPDTFRFMVLPTIHFGLRYAF